MKNKIKNLISRTYYIVLVIGILLMAFALLSNTLEKKSKIAEGGVRITPEKQYQTSWNTRKYEFSTEKIKDTERCIRFFTAHMAVWVYADDRLVYNVEQTRSVFSNSPGVMWNFVDIPPGTVKLTVIVQAAYPQGSQKTIDFYIGDTGQMYRNLLYSSSAEVIVSLLDMMVGIVLVGYWLMAHKRVSIEKDIFYFGVFALLIGIWSFNETKMATILIPNRMACAFISATALMLMIPPFVQFVKCFWKIKDECVSDVICVLAYLNFAVQIILQFAGIRGLRQMLFITHVLMVMALAYMTGTLVYRVKKRGMDHRIHVSILGTTVLVGAFLLDMLLYYIGPFQTDIIGRFGVLIYICILALETCAQTIRQVDEGRKVKIYKELAMKDMLTGLYNRNSYDEWVKEKRQTDGTIIITFDLNNLKHCNDTMGHAMGDSYIKNAAEIISRVFGSDGRCYRIGGDEFCAVIQNNGKIDIDDKIRQLKQEQDEFNENHTIPQIQIAYGYAEFDAGTDLDFENTRSRADVKMYEKKRALKEEGR